MFDAAPPPGDHSLMQDPAFAAALRLCGQDPVTLPCGLTVLRRGRLLAMLPRAVPPPDLGAQMAAVGLGRVPLILSPETPWQPRGLRLRRPALMAQIDLCGPPEERRAALHGKWRNQLRRAEAANLRLRHGPLTERDTLLTRHAAEARARGYRGWPVGLTLAFARVAPSQTRLFTATLRGHPVAEMLFLRHGNRATYHIGLTTSEGRAHHAHNLILWQAQNWLAAQGVTRIDLGPLDSATPDLNRFKLRSGARAQATGGTYLCWTPLGRRD